MQEGHVAARGSRPTWHGMDREQIDWHPTVIPDGCVGSDVRRVLRQRCVCIRLQSNLPTAVEPGMCIVGCTTCATLCPFDAIETPSRGYIHGLTREEGLLYRTNGRLGRDRAKYDMRSGQA
jgi:ferredoxin